MLGRIKQELHNFRDIEHEQSVNKIDAIQKQVSELENNKRALRYAIDAREQYSRRNCLLYHGVPETTDDTGEAVLYIYI